MKRLACVLLGVAATTSACSTIFGDFFIQGTEGTGADGGTTTGTTSTTGTGDAGGCEADASACGSACVDLQTDGHNCGRCGHDCLYGACSAGICKPWPVAMNVDVAAFPGALKPANQLDADGKYVVWVDSAGSVHQVQAQGGTPVNVVPAGASGGGGPSLRNATVAFVGTGSASVFTVPEGQGTASAQASIDTATYMADYLSLTSSGAIAFLSGELTTSPNQYVLLRCPLNGSNCAQYGAAFASGFVGLQVNANYAFFKSANALSRIEFATGTSSSVMAMVQVFAIDANNVYWATRGPYTVYSLPQSFPTGMMPQTLASNAMPIVGLASDGTYVYFGTFDAAGNASLYYIPTSGSAVALYNSQWFSGLSAEAYFVAVGGAVYWADINLAASPPTSNIMGIAAP